MDLTDDLANLSLDSFEFADDASESGTYSFVGLTVDSRITDILTATEEDDGTQTTIRSASAPEQGISVERFFEECFDTGIAVFSESSFGQKTFIGSGATMEVYKSEWRERKQMVALKYFKTPIWSRLAKAKSRSDDHRRLLEACMLELRVLTHEFIKRHENIANLLGVSWQANGDNISPILIMELACEEHPTLKELLALDTPLKTRLELVRDVLEGLSALHQIDVVHGDIKPENILIFKSSLSTIGMSARLSDFGFCRPTADYKYGAGGTPYWNAPECLPGAPADLKKEEYGKPRDLYSLGLLAFHAVTLQMPFGSATPDHIAALKLRDEVSSMLSKRLLSPESDEATVTPSQGPTRAHESKKLGRLMDSLKRRTSIVSSSSSSKPSVPSDVVDIIGQMVARQPAARPSIDDVRASLQSSTSSRTIAVRPTRESKPSKGTEFYMRSDVLLTRHTNRGHGVGNVGGSRNLDRSLPRDLVAALHEGLVRTTKTGSRSERAAAMNRLGVFFLQGFGAAKSFQKAFSWFCLAAEHGSIEARKMVFRMERAADTLPERVEATLSDAVRAAWMVDAIVDACKGDIDERMLPEGITLNGILERVRGVLSSVDACIARHGLVRDIEHNVVRIMAYNPAQDQTRRRTREHLRETAKDSPVLSRALEYIYADMPDALDQHLMTNPVPLAFLDRLVTTAADYGHLGVLRSLCVKHGANPNYIDTPSGRKLSPLTTAAKSSDFATVTTLLDCGANAAHLLIAMPATVNHGSSPIMGLSMQLIEKQVGRDYMDGITPSMNGAFANDDTPPDNSNPPPLFYAVLFNRLDKIFSLLVRGANPNVRFEGWTAVHLAVRMLHPSALLLLLAFGADPNARNSKEGYTTPLHTLSEVRLQLPEDSPGFNLQPLDFLLRPYQRLPVDTDGVELVQRRAIIVRILLKCGANPSARCIDGFTPLMTSIVTPAPDAAALTTLMLEAGVSVEDRTSRGETVLHVCVMAIAHQRLKPLLEHGARSLVDAMDMSKCTPLILACMMQDGSPQVVKILLDHEADMTIRGPFGLTALDVALLVGNTVILDHLLARAATLPAHLLEKLLQGVDEDLRNPFHFCLASPDLAAATDRFNRLRTLTGAADIRKLGSQRDRNGYTPYHLALFRRNIAACRILTSECGVADSLPPGGREDAAFPSIHTIRSRREEVMKAKDSRERETLIDECEYTGGSKSLTPAEIRHQSELDEAIRLHGDRSRQAIWCMDTLGTVHERYGRLRKAQDIYHSGWLKALESLGPKNRITHDLACKLLRVLRVRGVEETEVPYVANWHAVNGSNTIGAGLVIESEANLGLPGVLPGALSGNKEPGDFRQPGLSKKAVSCVRENCGKPSTMVCDGCKHIPYCSEACRIQDMVDPRVQHHLGCILADSIPMSLAIRVIGRDPHHPVARQAAQLLWDTVRPSMHPVPGRSIPHTAPAVKHISSGILTPAHFTKPVAMVIPKNRGVHFTNTDLYEIRLGRRQNTPWTKGGIVVAVRDMDVLLRPVEAAVRAEAERTKDKEPEEQEVAMWMEIGLDWDFAASFPEAR